MTRRLSLPPRHVATQVSPTSYTVHHWAHTWLGGVTTTEYVDIRKILARPRPHAHDPRPPPRPCRGRSPYNPGFQTLISAAFPEYALYPSVQVAVVQMDRAHTRGNPGK